MPGRVIETEICASIIEMKYNEEATFSVLNAICKHIEACDILQKIIPKSTQR